MIRTLVLNDGTEIMMEDNSTIRNARVLSASKAEMVSTWDKFTNANLKKVETYIDGEFSGGYSELVLDDETSVVQADGKILTEYHLREKTELEILRERVAALEAGQGVQDGAIDDLGIVTSSLAEKVEGGQA